MPPATFFYRQYGTTEGDFTEEFQNSFPNGYMFRKKLNIAPKGDTLKGTHYLNVWVLIFLNLSYYLKFYRLNLGTNHYLTTKQEK